MFRHFLFGLLWFVVMALMGDFYLAAGAATPAAEGIEDDGMPPDFNYIRGKAEAGSAKAQTLLGDFYMAASDFTNAVLWYRKGAGQADVGAQLTLASCLITGRGTAKDPQEAAKWLREAARLIESQKPLAYVAVITNEPAPSETRAIVITKTTVAASSTEAVGPTNSAAPVPSPPPLTTLSRVQRVDSLHAVEPVLQEARPALKSYPDSR